VAGGIALAFLFLPLTATCSLTIWLGAVTLEWRLRADRKAPTASRPVLDLHIRSPSFALDEECASTCNLQLDFFSW